MAEEHADELMVAHLDGMRAAPNASYSPEDRAFHQFWYSHMFEDLMQPPLIGIPHSTARYIWDAALRTAHVQKPAEIEHVADDVSKNWAESNMSTQQPAQAAPAAMHSDLRARCVEVLAWRETGTLPGEALRTLAREKYGDRYDAIQRAERDTETEALNFVAAAPTTQPAPQQDAQEGKK